MPWFYNCAFPVVTMKEQNGLGSISPMVSFETNPYPHNTIKTICRESKCKSRAELAKLAWAIMPKYRANECEPNLFGICRVQPIFNEVKCSFAYSKKKRWVLCVSHQFQSVILVSFFSLCLKGDYRNKGKIGLVYRTSSWREQLSTLNDSLALPSMSTFDRRLKSWLGIAQTSLGLSTRYSVRSPFKYTVHFSRECERVMICSWDLGEMMSNVVQLFPKCT